MIAGNCVQERLGKAIENLKTEEFENCLSSWLQTALRYDNLSAIAYFQNKPPFAILLSSVESKVHENFEKIYVNGAYLLDPFHELHIRKAPSGVYRIGDISPDQFRRNRYFLEYYQSTNLIDEIAFIAYPSEGVSVHFCLGRDSVSGKKFSKHELATSRTIAPILCALIQRHYDELKSTGKFDESSVIENLIVKAKDNLNITLSPRQAQVAIMVLQGHSSIAIGLQLEISPQTVKVFRKQLYKKCQISSQAELFKLILPLLRYEI